MALTPNLVFTAVDQDGVQSTLTDSTVYGGANPDRNEVAVFLKAYKVDVDQVKSSLAIESFDPELATTFRVTNDVDGWYQFLFAIVDYWLIGTTYNEDDIVWSPTEDAFYLYINASPSAGNLVTNSTYFTEISDPTAYPDAPNIIFQQLDKVITYQTGVCFIKAASKHAKDYCDGDGCGCDTRLGRLYHKIRELFTNMGFNDVRGLYLEGEKNARLAEKYCSDCGCLND